MAQAMKLKLPVRRSEADDIIQRGCLFGKVKREQLISGQSPAHQQLKMAVAALLCEKVPQRDWGKIQDTLNCSSSFVAGARALAGQQGTLGDTFRELLDGIRKLGSASAAAKATESVYGPPEPKEKKLKRLSRAKFNVDTTPPGNEQRRAWRLSNCAIAYIARWVMKKDPGPTAALVGMERISVETILQEAWDEYHAKHTFYEKVNSICGELGLKP